MYASTLYKSITGLLLGGLLLSGCSGDSEPASQAATPASPPPAPNAAQVLDAVQARLGTEGMDTITFSGTAWRIRNSFRQTRTTSPPWTDRDEITDFVRTIDLNAPSSRATGATFASNMFLLPPTEGVYQQNVTPAQTAWGQQLEIWLTPWGFLKGAEQNGATVSSGNVDGQQYTVLSWQSPASQTSPSGMRYTVNGYIDADNLVSRVETWVEDAFMGDMHVVALYDNYQDMNGVLVPTTMEQQRGGGGIFGVTVAAAASNPANAAELLAFPEQPAGGPGGPPPAQQGELSEQLAAGVYLIKTAYNALLVEFSDHVAVFEAGGNPGVGQQIVAEAARLFPNKPLRYLIVSHPHSDHTAGMIPVVRAGATIVTHESNVDFMNMALSTPRTLLGEEPLNPQFMAAGAVTVLEDATRRLELHRIENLHSEGTLVAYLPNERVLFQADFTLPVGGAEANPFVVNLAEYVDANGLSFDRYLAVHAAAVPQTMADLLAAIGK